MRRIITEYEKRKTINLAKNGFSRNNIAKMVGIGSATVDRILRKAKVSTFGQAKSIYPNHDNEIKELHSKGIPCKEASKQLGLNYHYYLTRRLKLGLKYIRAKQIKPLTQIQKEILLGTMLGDGNISISGNGTRIESYVFNMGHSWKQSEYFDWKYEQLDLKGKVSCRLGTKGHWGIFASSKPYENLKYYYWMFYRTGKKSVTKYMINKFTALSIAIWFMDDGTKSDTYYISTKSYKDRGCKIIQEMLLRKFNIETTLNYPTGPDQPIIRIRASSRSNFTKLIKPYIVPTMQYKLIQ